MKSYNKAPSRWYCVTHCCVLVAHYRRNIVYKILKLLCVGEPTIFFVSSVFSSSSMCCSVAIAHSKIACSSSLLLPHCRNYSNGLHFMTSLMQLSRPPTTTCVRHSSTCHITDFTHTMTSYFMDASVMELCVH